MWWEVIDRIWEHSWPFKFVLWRNRFRSFVKRYWKNRSNEYLFKMKWMIWLNEQVNIEDCFYSYSLKKRREKKNGDRLSFWMSYEHRSLFCMNIRNRERKKKFMQHPYHSNDYSIWIERRKRQYSLSLSYENVNDLHGWIQTWWLVNF